MKVDMTPYMVDAERLAILKDPEQIMERFGKGETFQDIMGFSNDVVMDFYEAASRLYERKRFEDAINAFVFLTTINPFVTEFWIGMGMCYEELQDFEKALMPYSWAIISAPDEITPYLYAIDCCFIGGHTDRIPHIIEQINKVCEMEDPELEQFRAQAKELLTYTEERLKKKN